ncbi:MAG: [protein-PII] uridylyltransferase [Pseudomonadota bacterium]
MSENAPTLVEARRPVSRKPGKWRIANIIDARSLRVNLTAAAMDNLGDDQAARARMLDLLHGALFRGRLIAQERLQQGADGLDTARLLAAVQDEVISALFDFTTTHVFRARNPTDGERLAVAATGGYGRGVLAPSSDIDLLFLRSYKASAHTESVVEYILYALWDMGLKVGHAFRTPQECARLANSDVTIKTSLLDARYIAGDQKLYGKAAKTFQKESVAGKDIQFIADKLDERDRRHARQGDARYVVEPNVKEGKGGLRDLQTLYWITKHIYGGETLEDVMQTGGFTEHEYQVFIRAARFLWTVRCHLHYITGRPEERLSFDLQPEIANRMNYLDRTGQLGVERFMKRYFLAAKDVGGLTRILSAKLEADQKKKPEGLRRLLPTSSKKPLGDTDFCEDTGRISISNDDLFDEKPEAMLELFVEADSRGLDVHPDALTSATRHLKRINADVRKEEAARSAFMDVLLGTQHPGPTLKRMNEAGVLGRFVPEFGGIVAQTQFNMYHHYTVDEHTLRAVEVISDIEHSRTDNHRLATTIFPDIESRRALYLAMLLHDTGKGLGDQQIEGMKTSRRACRRLGLGKAETELVAWLVGNHLEMSETAQKRDISDPRTVAKFTELVGSLERLRLLYVLTIADICAVGPNVWNGWKGQLLADLYHSTAAALRGGRTSEGAITAEQSARAEQRKSELAERIETIPAVMQDMERAYWAGFEVDELEQHADLVKGDETCRVRTIVREDGGGTALLTTSRDRVGLFASFAGAIAGEGANIVSAQAFTTTGGRILDIFMLQDDEGDAFAADDERRRERLERAVLKATTEDIPPPEASTGRNRREAAFLVRPQVQIHDDVSADATVIDVTARDRPGLLCDIASVLAQSGLSIRSAHVASYGERVFDAFYVEAEDGAALPKGEARDALRSRLLGALGRDEPKAPVTPVRALRRARSADSF